MLFSWWPLACMYFLFFSEFSKRRKMWRLILLLLRKILRASKTKRSQPLPNQCLNNLSLPSIDIHCVVPAMNFKYLLNIVRNWWLCRLMRKTCSSIWFLVFFATKKPSLSYLLNICGLLCHFLFLQTCLFTWSPLFYYCS